MLGTGEEISVQALIRMCNNMMQPRMAATAELLRAARMAMALLPAATTERPTMRGASGLGFFDEHQGDRLTLITGTSRARRRGVGSFGCGASGLQRTESQPGRTSARRRGGFLTAAPAPHLGPRGGRSPNLPLLPEQATAFEGELSLTAAPPG